MSSTGGEPDGDYAYDMAHDDMSTPERSSARSPGDPPTDDPPAEGTQTAEAEGDYSYDLAHEVPRRGPESPSL